MARHVSGFRVVSVPVGDVDRAKAFYADVLGFEVRRDNAWGDGMRWVELVPPGSTTAISLVTWFDRMQPGGITGLVLETPDARAAHHALRERGVAFTGEVHEEPWGVSASFTDPDGNGWVLMQEPAG